VYFNVTDNQKMKLLLAFVIVCAMAVVIHAQTEDDAWIEYKVDGL
jgi:intracellular septation protein A